MIIAIVLALQTASSTDLIFRSPDPPPMTGWRHVDRPSGLPAAQSWPQTDVIYVHPASILRVNDSYTIATVVRYWPGFLGPGSREVHIRQSMYIFRCSQEPYLLSHLAGSDIAASATAFGRLETVRTITQLPDGRVRVPQGGYRRAGYGTELEFLPRHICRGTVASLPLVPGPVLADGARRFAALRAR